MLKLLVVDDVAIIADGLHALFSGNWKDQMEVYKAYSVPEALDIVQRIGVDIIVTDIRMPPFSGIELLKKINEEQPSCKVIFLTSYHDFHFAREAVTHGGFDFILKTEGDERIIQAVNNAANELRRQQEARQLVDKAQAQYQLARPTLQKQFLQQLLQGMHGDTADREAQFEALDMPFRPAEPAFLAIARMDEWKHPMTWTDKALLQYSIKNIMDEYLSRKVRMVVLDMGSSHFVVIWQPNEDRAGTSDYDYSQAFRHFYGTFETVQNTCKELLKLQISFILGAAPSSWETLGLHLQHLELLLQSGIGLNKELLTTDAELLSNRVPPETAGQAETAFFMPTNPFSLLPDLLAGGKEEPFFALLDELSATVNATGNALGPKLEAIYFLSNLFLQYMNRRRLLETAARHFGMNKWLSVEEDPDWNSCADFYRRLARFLFDHASSEKRHGDSRLVHQVQQYIVDNIGSDLSLARLAEHVHFNPSYLSRLYKQITGVGLSDYIMEARMAKAKELLDHSNSKIHEIAEAIGYQSGIAFNRFFKRMMNISPNDYRRMRITRYAEPERH